MKRRRIAQLASTIAIIIFGFSVYQFVKLYQKQQFMTNAKHLITEMKTQGIHVFDVDKDNINYKKNEIKLLVYGNLLNNKEINKWNKKLIDYNFIDPHLILEQSQSTDLQQKVEELSNLYARNQEIISSRDQKIEKSEDKIKRLQKELDKYYRVPFTKVSAEARTNYDGLKSLSYGNVMTTNFKSTDTISIFGATWYDSIPNTKQQEEKLRLWLKIRLELDSVRIIKN